MHPTDRPNTTPSGPLALLGGEGLRANPAALWQALAGLRPGGAARIVAIPAALAAHKLGAAERSTALAADTLRPLGYTVEAAPVHSRADAEDAASPHLIEGADAILLTGGRPDALAATLQNTPLWAAILDAWQSGCLLAAAGGAASGLAELSFRPPEPPPPTLGELAYEPVSGLGLLRGVVILPYAGWLQRELVGRIAAACPPGTTLVEIDEAAALAHDGTAWQVLGAGSISVHVPGHPVKHFAAGAPVPADLIPAPER